MAEGLTLNRIEDGAWDPSNPNDFYFLTTEGGDTSLAPGGEVKCIVKQGSSDRRARLVRAGKVYASGKARRLVISRRLEPGAYRLIVGGRPRLAARGQDARPGQ